MNQGVQCGEGKREAQIPRWLAEVNAALKELDDTITTVFERTSTVAMAESPIANKCSTEAPDEMLVPVADRLREIARTIGGFNVSLRGLRNRIEL